MSRTFKHLKLYFSPKAQTTSCLSKKLVKPDQQARNPIIVRSVLRQEPGFVNFLGSAVPIMLSTWGPSSQYGLLAAPVKAVLGVPAKARPHSRARLSVLPGLDLIKGLFSPHFD